MSNRTRGIVLLAAGAILLVVGVGADALGLGGHPGFGWKQILSTLIGAGAALAGLRDLRR